jgi:hypothetical protein
VQADVEVAIPWRLETSRPALNRHRPRVAWLDSRSGGPNNAAFSRPSIVTGINDHSRFCVSAKVVERATARPVCDALLEAMRRYEVPEGILSDNGKVFTGRFGAGRQLVPP